MVQIIATMTFTALLMVIGFMEYSKEFVGMAKKMMKRKFSGWMWFYIVIWLVLLVWALSEIFL